MKCMNIFTNHEGVCCNVTAQDKDKEPSRSSNRPRVTAQTVWVIHVVHSCQAWAAAAELQCVLAMLTRLPLGREHSRGSVTLWGWGGGGSAGRGHVCTCG